MQKSDFFEGMLWYALWYAAVCCIMLWYAVVCCGMLQYAAVCGGMCFKVSPLSNIIPKSPVTLHFLKCLKSQIKAHIKGFKMRYKSFLGHWYPKRNSWFSDLCISTFHLFW